MYLLTAQDPLRPYILTIAGTTILRSEKIIDHSTRRNSYSDKREEEKKEYGVGPVHGILSK